MTVTGQPTVAYGYDTADRLTSITQGSSLVGFTYDNAGRRTTITLPNGVATEHAYDAASRITALTYKHGASTLGAITYAHDTNGNRRQVGGAWARTGLPQAVSSATYNAANHQLTFGNQTLTYDLNGNLITDGTNTYTWDARNQLAAISGSSSASLAHDALGRRRQKTINGGTTTFLYDGLNPVQENAGGGVTNLLAGLSLDEFLLRSDAGGAYSLLADGLGSIIAMTDGAGTVSTEYTYEPFGATTATGASSPSELQFTGRENDGTGLYYYRARYYHPTLQRFISEDPIGFGGGGPNLYAYVANSPTRWTDPLGLRIEWGNYVLNNPYVHANLHRLNQELINQGRSNNDFTLRITGGDRYVDSQGNIRSSTTQEIVRTTRTSEHLIENGARGVDLNVSGANKRDFDRALRNTDFLPENTRRYPDGHTHIALPRRPEFMLPPDSLPADLSGRKDLYGP
jgi:RHS repeat-associated protein